MKRVNIIEAIFFILALFASGGSCQTLDEPPISGKFFYSQLFEQDYQLYTKTIVGDSDPQQVLHLFPTTQELTIGIFTPFCYYQDEIMGRCDVTNFYDHTKDSAEDRSAVGIAQEVAYLYQDGGISVNKMQGMEITTNINLTVPAYYRQTVMNDLYMLSIQQLSTNYTSSIMGGYLGLGPYTSIDVLMSAHLQKQEVFLYELQDKQHIDHQTVAIYVSNDPKYPSYLKFGSYDRSGFANPEDISIFKTVNSATWAIQAKSTFKLTNNAGSSNFVEMGDGSFFSGNFLIDPGFPFFYIPETYFKKIVDEFSTGPLTYFGADFNYERIKFNSKCSDVNTGTTTQFRFALQNENNDEKEFTFSLDQLLVDGAVLGQAGSCYLGVFPNTNAPYPTMVYAGTLFLKEYYAFFDMSGYDGENLFLGQTLRVGIGAKNKLNNAMEKQYNKFYDGYAPYMKDQSNFTFTPNKYTYQPIKDPISREAQEEPENNVLILVISISIVVFLLALLIGLIVMRKRQIARKKLEVYKELVNENMRPSDLGESTFNPKAEEDLNYSINQPIMNNSINQSSQSLTPNF